MRPAGVASGTDGAARGALFDAALIGAAAALLLLPSLLHGPPTGHDYPHHRAWIEAFTAQLSLAEPYPRWLGGLWFGAGGADFYFYPPLTYWLAGLVGSVCGGCGPEALILAVGLVALAASGLGFRALGLRFSGRGPALVAALVYMALPYHLGADWYLRLALAEFTAISVLPWHLAAFLDCVRGRAAGPRLALLSALLALAHLPTAVVVTPGYLLVALVMRQRASWRALGRAVLAGGLGLALAAVYWVPAVALLGSVRGDLLGAPATALVNLFAPVNLARTETVALLWPSFAALSGGAVLAGLTAGGAAVRAAGALLALGWVMATPLSLPLWQTGWLGVVQYPWRFLVLADLGFALAALGAAATLGAAQAPGWRRGLAGAALGGMALVALAAHPVSPFSGIAATPAPRAPTLAGAFEWMPRETGRSGFIDYGAWQRVLAAARAAAEGPAVRLQGAGELRLLETAPRELVFEGELPAPARVVIHRTYWRFWELENLETGARVAIVPTEGFPLISATLPAGRARYRLELPVLPEERTGWLLSALSLAVLLAWGWLARPRRRS